MTPVDWTPFGISGFRRRWRPNWRLLLWGALNAGLWFALVYAVLAIIGRLV